MPHWTTALSWIMPSQLSFSDILSPIITGLVIALVGHGMEVLLLQRHTVWISTILDFFAASAITYFIQFFMTGIYVTLTGAIYTGVVVALIEHFLHIYLVGTGKTQKSK